MAIGLPNRRLVSQNDSAIIANAQVPRSRFIGSWTHKTTFDAGWLVPFLVEEILPGDHMTYDVTAYLRLATPLFPIFDNQRVDTFFFFVPNRLVWDNWVKFMGEQDNPGDFVDYTIPQIVSPTGGFAVASLYDYMGLPVVGQITAGQTITINALPLRGYNLIWNAWFRDQNIQSSAAVIKTNGPDGQSNYQFLQPRGKSHDYFTSALPWPQKFTAPNVPIAGTAPIVGIAANTPGGSFVNTANFSGFETGGAVVNYANAYSQLQVAPQGTEGPIGIRMTGAATGVPDVYANLAAATGVSINALRQSWMIQSLLERDARGGTRYVELIRSHFGVTNPDFRLQRPEYIGGGQSPLIITPVAQTAPSAGVTVGALGAAGTAAGSHRASYASTEHGYIIGLINVRSELSYQQGINKLWSRLTRYDFYFPALAGLGEQAILRQEIYATGVDADDTTVFGYQERWHEYRTRVSEVSGMFRSTTAGTLDAWHLAQRFLSPPTLSHAFIQDDPPMTRVLAAGALSVNQEYLADIMISRQAVRPIPMFGTPAQLGRF